MENLNTLEATILRVLEGHQGRENAVSRSDLVDRVNQHCPLFPYNERRIRRVIKHLIERHGYWIGSRSRGGYFMIMNDEEFFEFRKYYRGYAMSILHNVARIEKRALPELLGQLVIEFSQST